MLPFNLIPITPAYAKVLAKIHETCFDHPWTEKDFQELLILPTTRGYVCDQGFILICVLPEAIEILTLGVVPDARRQGLGRHLIETIKKSFPKIPKIFLEVNATNAPAIALYEQTGFKKTGVRKGYYRTPQGLQDALCYTWNR